MNSIYKLVTDRLANPLIFSFIISWIFWNWEIVVGLIWYNAENIGHYGYDSYEGLIRDNSNPWFNWAAPFGTACFYTFAWPWIRNWIDKYLAKRNRDSQIQIKSIQKDGYVPVEALIELQEYNDKTKSTIETLAANIREMNKDSGRYLTAYNNELEKNSTLQNRLDTWVLRNSTVIFDGEWQAYVKQTNANGETSKDTVAYDCNISSGRLTFNIQNSYDVSGSYNATNGVLFLKLEKNRYANIPEDTTFDISGIYEFSDEGDFMVLRNHNHNLQLEKLVRKKK